MGADRTTVSAEQKSTATPEERELNQLQLGQAREFDPLQRQMNTNAGNLVNQLLTGQNLPGYLNMLPGGIDKNVTQGIVDDSLKDLYPMFQQNGILDSGVAAQIAGRTSADIRQNSAQFNLQNLQQLLNLAVGGQAQVQQPVISTAGMLGQRLAGLRTTNTSQTTTAMNPFLKSFQQSAGEGLGKGASAGVTSMFCWVASEIFGGWDEPKTVLSRFYIGELAPKWFKSFYIKNGEAIAKFIKNKPILKNMLRPLFEMFVKIARSKNG